MKKRAAVGAILLSVCLLAGCASSDYKTAKQYYENGEYEKAAELFEALGDYKDAAEQAGEAKFCLGKAAQKKGKYEKALEIYEDLGDYEPDDLEERMNACRYALAEEAEAEGDLEKAAKLFGKLGKYQDSKQRKTACEYAIAVGEYENGDYASAAEDFADLSGYEDADEYYAKACSEQAREAFLAEDWKALREILGEIEYVPEEGGITAEVMLGVADAYDAFEAEDFTAVVALLECYDRRNELTIWQQAAAELFEEDVASAAEVLDPDATAAAVLTFLERSGNPEEANRRLTELFTTLAQGDSYPAFPYMDSVLEQISGTAAAGGLETILSDADENRVFCYLRSGTWMRMDGASMKNAILELQDGATEPLGVLIDVTNIPSKLFFAGDVKWKTIVVTGRDSFTMEDYMVHYSGNTILSTSYLDCRVTIDYANGTLKVITVENASSTNGAVQNWKLIPPEDENRE